MVQHTLLHNIWVVPQNSTVLIFLCEQHTTVWFSIHCLRTIWWCRRADLITHTCTRTHPHAHTHMHMRTHSHTRTHARTLAKHNQCTLLKFPPPACEAVGEVRQVLMADRPPGSYWIQHPFFHPNRRLLLALPHPTH